MRSLSHHYRDMTPESRLAASGGMSVLRHLAALGGQSTPVGEFNALSLQHFPQDAPQEAVVERQNAKSSRGRTQNAG
jgi:hypothetical protein